MKRTVKSVSSTAAMTAALSAIRVPGSTFSHASPRLAIPSASPATGVGKLLIRSERLARRSTDCFTLFDGQGWSPSSMVSFLL